MENLELAIQRLMATVPEHELKNIQAQASKLREWKIAMFNPHPKQEKFHEASAHTRLFQGGNRSGKTTSGAVESVAYCLGYRPWLSESHPGYRTPFRPPVYGRIVCEDFKTTAGLVIVGKLREWLPSSMIEAGYPKKNQIGVETEWKLKNGSSFTIMTNEQETKVFEGIALHFCWYDEPPRRDIYIANKRGLVDAGGYEWLTMTPLAQPWIYDEIVLKAKRSGDIFFENVDILDNVGFGLSQENVDRFAEALNPEEKEMRLRGKFHHLTGLVYKDFNPQVHVVDRFPIPAHWPRIRLIDPHPRTPHAVMWMAKDHMERIWVYDELFQHCMIDELCDKIKAKTAGDKIRATFIDPIAFNEDPLRGERWADEFARNGVRGAKAVKDLARGIPAVSQRLRNDTENGLPPSLFFFSDCQRTIWEIGRYQWDDWKGRTRSDRNPKETPKDVDDHMMENLYRGVLMMPSYRNSSEDDKPLKPKPHSDMV